VKQSDLGYAIGESPQVAEIFPVPIPDLDLVNVHSGIHDELG